MRERKLKLGQTVYRMSERGIKKDMVGRIVTDNYILSDGTKGKEVTYYVSDYYGFGVKADNCYDTKEELIAALQEGVPE